MGYSQTFTFREIGPFSAILDNPHRSLSLVGEARSVLRAMFHQEEDTLRTLTNLVEERKDLILYVFGLLTAELKEMAEREGVELPLAALEPID